jgi:hypothetical protein
MLSLNANNSVMRISERMEVTLLQKPGTVISLFLVQLKKPASIATDGVYVVQVLPILVIQEARNGIWF